MRTFYSGYVTCEYAFYPSLPYFGKHWHLSLADEPAEVTERVHSTINGKPFQSKAVIIHSSSLERAQYVTDMIWATLCLSDARLPPIREEAPRAVPMTYMAQRSGRHEVKEELRHVGHFETSGLLRACQVAAAISKRIAYQNALFKYQLSQTIFSTDIMDLEPSHWYPTRFVFKDAQHHVRCAYSVTLAYSVIEELRLEVRASREKPSFINGSWNPKVRNDLETRLIDAGIDTNVPVPWTVRDTPTRIERERKPPLISKSEWAYGKIRDGEIDILDAIALASWLRSRVSAHRLGTLSRSLNYYDVFKFQHLARRLLLETLGFWPPFQSRRFHSG